MDKAKALLKLWNCFPSTAAMSDEQTAGYLEEWRDCVDPYSDAVVETACNALRRRDVAFLPSVGQIRAECERANADVVSARFRAGPALPPPKYSPEHREDMKRRFNELVAELRSGVNFNPRYGETPRGSKPDKQPVCRTVRGSFMDQWEREKGRPYPNRAAVEALLADPNSKFYMPDYFRYKDAAE